MQKISDTLKKDWLILILIIFGFALGAYFYPSLPDTVPTHWNSSGEVDGYGSKLFGAFGLPAISLGLYVMFLVIPYIDPKRQNYAGFKSTYQFMKYLIIMFFVGIEVMTLLIASGVIVNKPIFTQIMVSLLFILIGNVMGRFKHNYFVGIRTPWTLANEEVWRKTHRLAAPLWVFGGIINILLVFMGINFNFVIIVGIIAIVPIVYSYIAYQQVLKE